MPATPHDPLFVTIVQDPPPPPAVSPLTPSCNRPSCTLGLLGTSAAYLVPDHICRKFVDGWSIHIPLIFLTDKGCLFTDKSTTSSTQDMLTLINGHILTNLKPLSDDGELDLIFNKWHQAWQHLLDLIKSYLPEEFLLWEVHYLFILNHNNQAEMWLLFLAYDAEIHKRATQLPIDPSKFSIGIWNDLETRFTANEVFSLVQVDLKLHASSSSTPRDSPKNPGQSASFQTPHHQIDKFGRCFICGDRSRDHTSCNCMATHNINGSPCHLFKQGPSGKQQNKSEKFYCFTWNGISGCFQSPCL